MINSNFLTQVRTRVLEDIHNIKTYECLHFFAGFVRSKMFEDRELLEALEDRILSDITELNAVSTAMFFNTRVKLAHWIKEECMDKKTLPMKAFHDFYRRHDVIYSTAAQ